MRYLIGLLLLTSTLFSCKQEHVFYQPQWGEIFKKHGIDSACFEMVDNTHDQAFVYNLDRCSRRMSPASTFKVFLSLVALETNIAPDENLVIAWDKIPSGKPEWDRDMTMREALKASSEPYYKTLAKRIGKIELQRWIDSTQYGNKQIGENIDQCWTNDALLITPDEQVGLMKKLYFDKLPMSQRAQRIVRSMMVEEETPDYKLYIKTGTRLYNKKTLAWVVGFIERRETQKGVMTKKLETNNRPYFFAMNYETSDERAGSREERLRILHEILQERQIIPIK